MIKYGDRPHLGLMAMEQAKTGNTTGLISPKYEKYIVRGVTPGDPKVQWGRPDLGVMHLVWLLAGAKNILPVSNTMLEYTWITKDSAFGVTNDRGPHAHPCAELFLFLGSNPNDFDDLGAEVEFWMGEGADLEKVKLNKSGLIYVPKDLMHLPLFVRNVKRPVLHMVIGLDIGDSLTKTKRYPPRNV